MNEVTIPLKISGIAQMKAELRELKGEIANATDPTQMTALAQRAGEVADRLKDANEQVAVFTAGSKFESISNSLAGVGGDLASLDFEGANEKAKVFAKNLGSLNPADISKGLKDFTGTLGILSKAFIKLGITILMNPIFLIVAAVVAIIAVIALVLKSFGVLDDVINAMMMPINALIAGFKALTDWLGLTSFAAEENAEKSLAANEKVSESSKNRTAIVTADLGREIAEAKAAGKDTTKLEKEKSDVQIKEANKRRNSARKALADQRKLGEDADQETIKKLKQQITEETELIKQGYSDKKVARLNDIAEAEADAEKAAEKAKAARDKFRAADKVSEDEIATAAKIVSDSKKTAQQIEIDDLKAAYAIKIATAIKYKNDTTALIEAQKIQEAAIIKKYDDEAKAKKAENDAKADAFRLDGAKSLNEKLAKLNDENGLTTEEAADLRRRKERKAAEDYYRELASDAANAVKLKSQDASIEDKIEVDRMNTLNDIEIKYADEKKARDKAVADNAIAEDKKVYDAKIASIQKDFEFAGKTLGAIEGITSLVQANKLKGVEKGSKEEEKILRKQFQLNKSMQLAGAIVDAGKAITASLASSPIAIGPVPNPAGIASLAFAATTSAINIAKIASTQFTSTAGPSADTPPSTTAVAPASGPNLFGNANTGSQVTAGGGSNNITVTAIVSETEITASQNHINNIQQNSVL
jgi:colicin import membrane protein